MGIKKLKEFGENIIYCLKFSWKTSPIYTIIRVISTILPSLLTVLLSYIGKYILDLLAGENSDSHKNIFIILLGIFLMINILLAVMRNISQYVQVVHSDMLNAKLSQDILQKSLNADLEYFDYARYHDALILATRNISAVTEIIWQTVQAISSGITSIGVFLILCSQNWLYGVLTVAASVPAAVVSIRYTKEIYQLDVEQINLERNKAYIQAIATEKAFAPNLRLYCAKPLGTVSTPAQKSMELGLFEVKESTIHNPDGSIRINRTTKVTGKGQQYFINKFFNGSSIEKH